MAGQAVLVRQALGVEHAANLVRRVAVDTGRNLVPFLDPQATLDHLAMHAIDLRVAGCAGRGHVVDVDTRAGVRVTQDVVSRVAGRADRRHGESLAEQALAVDAHRIVLEDALLRDLVGPGHRRTFPVAVAAEQRHVHHSRRRIGIRGGQDIVFAVTAPTVRGKIAAFG